MRPDERVTEFIDDGGSSRSGGLPRSPSHQSSSSSSTAPVVPMALMSQSMTLPHGSSLRRENKPHPLMMTGKLNGMSVTMSSSSPKLNNRESELNTHRHLNGLSGETGKSIASPKLHQPFAMSEMLVEPVDDEGEGRTTWEYHSVTLQRVPGFGFGIAVSGGRDNPHFKSGDPSIVVSDVVRSGPAWGQLQVNDRILSANGVSLENAEYQAAVQIMKENEQLNMIVKRRVPLPAIEYEQRTLKFTLTKSRRKDDFGVVLGCKFYIKDITNPKLAEKEPGLKEGDTVLRVNGQSLEDVTLADAMKLLERSREKLSMVIQRDVPRGASWKWGSQNTLYERLGSLNETPRESPRASPMLVPRTDRSYSDDHTRLNNNSNSSRSPGRAAPRMTASEYVNTLNVPVNGGSVPPLSPHNRHSFGAGQHQQQQPASRSRTPNHYSQNASLDAEYGNYGARSLPPATPPLGPVPFPSTDESLDTNGSGLPPRPPLSAGLVPDVRVVHFRKEGGSVGVRVVGGNEVGIFVSAVQTHSPAASKGVRPGDKILKVNGTDMRGVTREEAVLYLLGLQDEVELLLQYRKDEYDRVRAQQLGDNFFIRTHFDHDKPSMQQELVFKHGDIFQIIDTLFGGTVGSWQAIKVYSPSDAAKPEPQQNQIKGVIPNAQTAEKLAALDPFRVNRANGNAENTQSNTLTKAGGAFFRRKMGLGSRRAKSLNKAHWDEVVFAQGNVQFAAYERVKLSTPGFLRPVVLFGPLADVSRELLLKDFPLRFASPSTDATQKADEQAMDTSTSAASHGIVRLSSIREIMAKNKHCLLDVTPSSVEKLQYAQYAPIVVFVDVDSRSRLRELRSKAGVSSSTSSVSTKKLLDQAARIKKYYSHLLTATLDATKEDQWFEALRELVSHLQDRRVWMAETKPVDVAADDFLFPMANSRFTNYDSDGESLKGDYSSDYSALPPQNGQSTQQTTTTLRDSTLNGSMYDDPRMQRSRYDNQRSLERSHSTAAAWNAPRSAGPYPQPNHPNTVYTRYYDDTSHSNYASQYGDIPPRPPPIARYRNRLNQQNAPPSAAYQMSMSQCEASDLYANRDTLMSHFVTMRRPQLLPNGDMKPPRSTQSRSRPASRPAMNAPPPDPTIITNPLFVQSAETCGAPPAVPPKPAGASMPTPKRSSASPKKEGESEAAVVDPAPNGHAEEKEREKSPGAKENSESGAKVAPSADGTPPPPSPATAAAAVAAAGCPTNDTKVDESPVPPHLRPGSYGNQAGYYDIKQILAEQADADLYHDASRATPSPPTYRAALASAGPADHGQAHSAPLSSRSPAYYDHSGGLNRTNDAIRPQMPPPATGFTLMNPAYRELDSATPPYPGDSAPQPYSQPPSYHSRPEVTRTTSAPDPAPRNSLPLRSGARPPPPLNTNGRSHMPPPPAPQPRSPRHIGPVTSSESSASPQPPGVYHLSRLSSQDESTPSPPPTHQVRLASASPTKGAASDETPRHSPGIFKIKPPLPAKPSALNGAGDCPSMSAFERYGRASGSEEREGSIAAIDADELDEAQHTVVAHVSGVIDSHGGTLSSEETGVSIYVPPGAIPPGVQQEIYFKVCRDSQMAPPLDPTKGETLLSPLVMCGPQGLRFDKSVELRLPHSASGVNSEQWSFALKSASGAEAEWKQVSLNESLDGNNKQSGRLDDKFVCVQIDHF